MQGQISAKLGAWVGLRTRDFEPKSFTRFSNSRAAALPRAIDAVDRHCAASRPERDGVAAMPAGKATMIYLPESPGRDAAAAARPVAPPAPAPARAAPVRPAVDADADADIPISVLRSALPQRFSDIDAERQGRLAAADAFEFFRS